MMYLLTNTSTVVQQIASKYTKTFLYHTPTYTLSYKHTLYFPESQNKLSHDTTVISLPTTKKPELSVLNIPDFHSFNAKEPERDREIRRAIENRKDL